MPSGTTPNLGLTLPTIFGDAGIWGQELNGNFSLIDTRLGSFVGSSGNSDLPNSSIMALGANATLGKINGIVGLGDYPPVPALGYGYSTFDIAPALHTVVPADGKTIMGLSIGFATQVPNFINQMGLNVEMVVPSSNSVNMLGALYTIYTELDYNASGTLNIGYGGFFSSYNRGAGTMSKSVGAYAESIMGDPYQALGSGTNAFNVGFWTRSGALRGTCVNDYTVFIDQPYTGGVFTNGHTGLFINDQTAGGTLPGAYALRIIKGFIDFGPNNLFIASTTSGSLSFPPPSGAIGNVTLNWPTTSGTLAIVGGSTTQVQVNSGGQLVGDTNFTWDNVGKALTLGQVTTTTGQYNGVPLVQINSNAVGGIGANPLEVHGSFGVGLDMYVHATGNFGFRSPIVQMFKSRGTQASPTAVQSGDALGGISVGGYDGTSYTAQAIFQWKASENWTTIAHGTRLGVSVIPIGSINSTAAFAIADTSYIGIGIVNVPKFQFHMPGASYANLGAPAVVPPNITDMQTGSIVFYLDEAGNNLKVQVKYSNG